MDKLNSIEKAKFISNEYKEYLKSSFNFNNEKFQKQFNEELDQESLFKGPYLSLTLPFVKGKSLNELIASGIINSGFKELKSLNLDRKLYLHQEQSIKKINEGRSVVITTGTGSGKTECFLYPVINGIMNNIEEGHKEAGIRALFLYPMNALVNDQIERIRKILRDYPDITYAYFTGDTEEKVSAAMRKQKSDENPSNPIPDNELLSREEIRNNPPHILFTNYSMLEYLLIRPTDQSIFNKDMLNNWKYVILDEAHSYSGTKAIELSLLLRRVTGMSNCKQQFILTSATLGEQGKSEQDIINFAHNLTSSEYDVKDIIFSNRIHFSNEMKYRISNEDINLLHNNKNEINNICTKYSVPIGQNEKESLYNLLENDQNVKLLYEELKKENKTFEIVYKKISSTISESALIDLIDLINSSEKDGKSIFELKYHSFVRALSGIFMSFGKKEKITLTKTKYIDEFKAHEIGNCRYCNSSYIIGKEKKINGINYLIQNDEIDIYENYGDNDSIGLDYYLLDYENVDEIEKNENLIAQELCSKCGATWIIGNPNASKCSCEEEIVEVYKYIDSNKEKKSNNIDECPCCGKGSRSGVVRTLNLGKDEGTALVSQILYRSMEKTGTNAFKETRKINLLAKKEEPVKSEKEVKQYLAFSDSRQQASFFAIFLKHNDNRFLQKRIIWEVIKKHQFEKDIKIDVLIAELIKLIKEYKLFDNDLGETKNAWTTALVELLKVDGIYGGEGLGLFNFSLDLREIMDQLDEDDVKEAFGEYKIDKQKLEVLMQILFAYFRSATAIDITKSTLTPEDKKEVLEYRRSDNYMVLKKPELSKEQYVRSFLPVKGTNDIVKFVSKAFNCSQEKAEELISSIFNNIGVVALFDKSSESEKYQINANKYVLNNYKTTKYFRCKKCRTVTPHNLNDCCIKGDCDGLLEEINPDEVFKYNYYRKEYISRPIERMVVREHTAQLTRTKAKQYQKDFKNKEINVLSCSTTFEMGIDIGDLGTVFMRNVPPSPANYVQRAGRAGRSKDSTAFILTYCNLSSHDYTYFSNPNGMISGVINPPVFNVQNEKIIVRHLLAASLGFFFRKNERYYDNLDRLVFDDGISKFKEYLSENPKDLNEYINKKVIPEKIYDKYKEFKWFKDSNLIENLEVFESTMLDLLKDYVNAKAKAQKEDRLGDALYYDKQIRQLKEGRVIDNLSKYSVIPKYGFPVDVTSLQIYDENGHLDNRYDLNRDLSIAISEYAPDSEIVVDGNKYTSKYLTLPKGNDLKKYFYYTCESCGRLNISSVQFFDDNNCKYCGQENLNIKDDFFIEPTLGFKTGATKESTRMKPAKSYAGEVQYIGNGDIDELSVNINNSITIETSSNDQLVVKNKSNFYVCNTCGYSEVDKTNIGIPQRKRAHLSYIRRKCSDDQTNLIRLGHVFKTDVAKITCHQIASFEAGSYEKMLSFLYAFLEGMSVALNIDRNDINGLVVKNSKANCWDVLLYDNVPGGAGHVKRIINQELLKKSLSIAKDKVNQNCCGEDTSCYNCLRNFYNQAYHSVVTRNKAKEVINVLLSNFV